MTARQRRTTTRLATPPGGQAVVILTFEFHKEGGLWLGHCRELGTATDGRFLDKVEDELTELVLLHLDGLDDIGERERVFQERGIRVYAADVPAEVETSVPVTDEQTFVRSKPIRVSARTSDLVAV